MGLPDDAQAQSIPAARTGYRSHAGGSLRIPRHRNAYPQFIPIFDGADRQPAAQPEAPITIVSSLQVKDFAEPQLLAGKTERSEDKYGSNPEACISDCPKVVKALPGERPDSLPPKPLPPKLTLAPIPIVMVQAAARQVPRAQNGHSVAPRAPNDNSIPIAAGDRASSAQSTATQSHCASE
jgi:hypothetical protein